MNSEMQMQMKRTKREDLRFFMDFERCCRQVSKRNVVNYRVELLNLLTNPENATTVN